MSPQHQKVYFVAGANRGIGLALVKQLAATDNTLVFGSTRALSSDASSELVELASQNPNFVAVPLEITDQASIKQAAAIVGGYTDKIDVLIVNAGVVGTPVDVLHMEESDFLPVLRANVLGPLYVYREFKSFLRPSASDEKPVFVAVSSLSGSTRDYYPSDNLSYSLSKAALNHVVVAINAENPDITAFVTHPGVVVTDMLRSMMKRMGKSEKEFAEVIPVPIINTDLSASQQLAVIKSAIGNGDKYAGKFWNYDGNALAF